jgi:sugar fermentation stimulation protein A
MKYKAPLIEAVFIERPNRFLGIVTVDDVRTQCFIPNPGRLQELLLPGAEVHISDRRSEKRKTTYDLVLVRKNRKLVSIDSRVPNIVIGEAIEEGIIHEFKGYEIGKREYTYGDSRLDFLLLKGRNKIFLEVKSCTLVVDGIGLFPDAPTKRGRKHLKTLVKGLGQGRAAVVFLIQRDDALSLHPNEATDPKFADTIRGAAEQGLEVLAYTSKVTLEEITIKEKIDVIL